jgi:hypothetical protein
MMVTKVVCPFCARRLRTSTKSASARRVVCSRCQRSFSLEKATVVQEPASSSQPSDMPSRAPTTEVASPHALPAPASTPPLVDPTLRKVRTWAAVILAGLAVLLVVSLGMAVHFARKSGGQEAKATTPPAPDLQPGSNTQGKEDPERANPVRTRLIEEPRRTPVTPPVQDPLARTAPPGLAPPGNPQTSWLPPEEQTRVDGAIDRGVAFLQRTQHGDGSWPGIGEHHVGMAALPGLTLLECGVPADDGHVQKAAQHVRNAVPSLSWTYDLALGILFLDRLGDPADRPVIQTLALRLLAGQGNEGGWAYHCPVLRPEDERNLLTVMRSLQKDSPVQGGVSGPGGLPGTAGPTSEGPGIAGSTSGPGVPDTPPGAAGGPKAGSGSSMPFPTREEADAARRALPEALKRVPALNEPGTVWSPPPPPPPPRRGRPNFNRVPPETSDNSNTQFAILGVWVASRHQVPVDRALAHIARRFRTSQGPEGGWGYRRGEQGSPAITGAGLLGLAVGLGLARPESAPRDTRESPPRDPAVEKGLRRLAEFIGQPLGVQRRGRGPRPGINPYFLWTVERVGVLYNLRHFADKDWYHWGAELLVDAQGGDGSWMVGGYHAAVATTDTSFALLFLKRANLAQDLSKRMEFVIDIKGAFQGNDGAPAGQAPDRPR